MMMMMMMTMNELTLTWHIILRLQGHVIVATNREVMQYDHNLHLEHERR